MRLPRFTRNDIKVRLSRFARHDIQKALPNYRVIEKKGLEK